MNLVSLKDIPTSFSLAKKVMLLCGLLTFIIPLGSLTWAYLVAKNLKNTAYVLTKDGQAALLEMVDDSDIDSYRRPEIVHHIKMFHSAFWEIDQFSYERKINSALYLTGDSGKRLFKTLEASGHFAKISSENLTQKIEMDSISVDDTIYPYQGVFYGKLRVVRTDQKVESVNDFKAKFVLYNVARTDRNPHGLLIENYHLIHLGDR